jgi:hypothetical protein
MLYVTIPADFGIATCFEHDCPSGLSMLRSVHCPGSSPRQFLFYQKIIEAELMPEDKIFRRHP